MSTKVHCLAETMKQKSTLAILMVVFLRISTNQIWGFNQQTLLEIYVFVCVYTYIYIYNCICIYIYTCMYIFIYCNTAYVFSYTCSGWEIQSTMLKMGYISILDHFRTTKGIMMINQWMEWGTLVSDKPLCPYLPKL